MKDIDHPVIVNTRALPEELRGSGGLEGIASINDTPDGRPIEENDARTAMANIAIRAGVKNSSFFSGGLMSHFSSRSGS